jgi:uncharacterized glyoxalase superfamily protein PhnB
MSERTLSTEVEIEVDVTPDVAFTAFTDEMHRWWVPGPINFFDSSRALTVRCEGGLGGRIVEIYDASSGTGLELARITAWEPPARLAWTSSVDDVQVAVRFDPAGTGTRVVVEVQLPPGGRDAGGSLWARVTPAWFPAWCRDRTHAAPGPPTLSRLAVCLEYDRPAAVARWLHEVLGLHTHVLPSEEEQVSWLELRAGDALVIVLPRDGRPSPDGAVPVTATPWIFVDDLDAHHAAARAAGGDVDDVRQHGYRAYTARDPEGRPWTVAQTLPSMTSPAWGR